MTAYYIIEPNFTRLLEGIVEECEVYGTLDVEGRFHLKRIKPGSAQHILLGGIRPQEPLKSLLVPPKEIVSEYFTSTPAKTTVSRLPGKRTVVVGPKMCDLKSVEILDAIFCAANGSDDPFYLHRRDNMVLVSSDCTSAANSCFCVLLGLTPYPRSGFDLNLSAINGGVLLEVGTEKGMDLLRKYTGYLRQPEEEQLKERQANRVRLLAAIEGANADYSFDQPVEETIRESISSEVWDEACKSCVECGACTMGCPTCHCFFLFDRKADGSFVRERIWDVCTYPAFARVAGGANPRAKPAERFKHRFLHKLYYYYQNFKEYGCVGCGRCIEGCLGKLDVRPLIRSLEEGLLKK
jgi:ferredoxin